MDAFHREKISGTNTSLDAQGQHIEPSNEEHKFIKR